MLFKIYIIFKKLMIFHFLCEIFVLKLFLYFIHNFIFFVYYYLIKVCLTISFMLYVNKITCEHYFILFL
jgi:hypothetical protein